LKAFHFRSLKTRITLFMLAISFVSMWALAFYAGRVFRFHVGNLLGEQQYSTACFVAAEVNDRLDIRLKALKVIADSMGPVIAGSKAGLQAYLEQREVLPLLFNDGAIVLDRNGTAIASVPLSSGRTGIGYLDRDYVIGAIRDARPTIGRPVLSKITKTPSLSMGVPIRDKQGVVIGALAGLTKLSMPNFLDNIAENQYGKTGGYLLVSPQARLTITATDRSRIMEKIPAPGKNPWLDRFVNGYEGTAIMVDPIGVKVLTSVKDVPLSGWIAAVYVPYADAVAPIFQMRWYILIGAIILTFLSGVTMWWMLRRQLSPILSTARTMATLSDAHLPLSPLAVSSQDEIGDLISGFNRLISEVQASEGRQRLQSLGILAGGIAHDFNNLVGGILGYIDLANGESGNKKSKQYLAKALETIDRARGLTNQLLTFAKGGAPVRNVEHLFPFVQEATEFALSGSSVSCRFNVSPRLWPCNVDKNQISQVIDNIVINAQQAMPGGGAIDVSAENVFFNEKEHVGLSAGNYVRISIKDYGIGIPKDILPHIFDPFYTTKPTGHGLGLATCHSIITRHGGCIEVESEPGKGSTFHVFLPALAGSVSVSQEICPPQHAGTGTILVMDDEESILEPLAFMLETFGYTVVMKKDGRDAIDFFIAETKADHTIAAVILDLTVPGGLGGKEAVVELRKVNSKTPVFVSSGYATDPVMASPQEYGFTASICKPFTTSDLAKMLNSHLS
jgi:signal transduction histidine kinase/CheY-like chemotaxis protein